MEEIVDYIKNNTDAEKIKKIINVILFHAIYKRYPIPNTIAFLDILYQDEINMKIDIFDNINYINLMPIIKRSDNEILYGYFLLLYEHKRYINNIADLIKIINTYKFNTDKNITIDTLKSYILFILKPYIESHFDDKFIYSIFTPVNTKAWEDLHRNEIITRLENIMKLYNKNMIKMCNIKPKHISILSQMSFDELTNYFNLCGIQIRGKINFMCDYLDAYEILNNNIKKLVNHNNNYINNDININKIIIDNL